MLRLLGLFLDDIINDEQILDDLYKILKDNKRSAKLILYVKDVDDIEMAKFVKKYEETLINIGTKISRDMSVHCYYLITVSKDHPIRGYSMWFRGSVTKGLKHFKELIESEDARKRFIS